MSFHRKISEYTQQLDQQGLLRTRELSNSQHADFVCFDSNDYLWIALALSGGISMFTAIIMPKRTEKGAEINWQIKGFKLYMETAEKYRQQFNEKENIFEKFLPYAIAFGMTKEWVKKMKEIYGENFYGNYVPVWYIGNISNFDVSSLTSTIDNLSSSINSNMGTTSGAGGGGFSGGGGGGGGGGGW